MFVAVSRGYTRTRFMLRVASQIFCCKSSNSQTDLAIIIINSEAFAIETLICKKTGDEHNNRHQPGQQRSQDKQADRPVDRARPAQPQFELPPTGRHRPTGGAGAETARQPHTPWGAPTGPTDRARSPRPQRVRADAAGTISGNPRRTASGFDPLARAVSLSPHQSSQATMFRKAEPPLTWDLRVLPGCPRARLKSHGFRPCVRR